MLLTRGVVLGVAGLVLSLLLVTVSLLKVWRITPDDFSPVIRISWLDMVQSRMLAQAAREHLAAGRLRESAHAWRGAVANHPTSLPVLREWVQAAVTADEVFLADGGAPLNQAVMLLHLGGTNMMDRELTMQLLWRMKRPSDVLLFGMPVMEALSPVGAGLVARALFDLGDMGGFDRVWRRHEPTLAADPVLALHRAAWQAHWGPADGARAGRSRLDAALAEPELRTLALELARRIAVARADLDEHERWMEALIQAKAASIQSHAERCILLASNGRKGDAQRIAKTSLATVETPNATQTRLVVETLVRIDMLQEGLDVLKRRPPTQMRDTQLWMLHGKILEMTAQWDDLSALAMSLRSIPGIGVAVDEISYSMEAFAKSKQLRPDMAQLAAKRASAAPPGDQAAVLQASAWLLDAGMAQASLEVLKKAEPSLKGSVLYWGRRMMAASQAANAEDMLRSSEQCMAIAPGNPAVANNYAATLVVTGHKPAEAVKLTFENLSKFPGNPDFQINHAIALLLNERDEEAKSLLLTVDANRLTAVQKANFHLAWLDVAVRARKWPDARERGLLIDRSQLMPLQIAKLEVLEKQVLRAN
jgi:tetratricopeptide (TPR) repeat protein